MNLKRHPGLFLIFSAIMVTFCRCSMDTGTPATINFTNGKTANCLIFSESFSEVRQTFDCQIPCPKGQTPALVTVTFSDAASIKKLTDKGKFDLAALQKKYCTKTPAQGLSEKTPIPSPISIPNTSGGVTAAQPVLTEEITSCDFRARYINMRMVDSPPDLTGKNFVIRINNTEVDCVIPGNNPSLYSCVLPNGMSFPANILATVDDAEVNNFNYSGSNCLNLPREPEPNNPMPTNPPD